MVFTLATNIYASKCPRLGARVLRRQLLRTRWLLKRGFVLLTLPQKGLHCNVRRQLLTLSCVGSCPLIWLAAFGIRVGFVTGSGVWGGRWLPIIRGAVCCRVQGHAAEFSLLKKLHLLGPLVLSCLEAILGLDKLPLQALLKLFYRVLLLLLVALSQQTKAPLLLALAAALR